MANTLYYGDNLHYLREIQSDSVDLIYLDPPFNSQATYNLLFRTPEGSAVEAQTTAFKDTWTWETAAAAAALDDVTSSGSPAAGILNALRRLLGETPMMAYLAMMSVRLTEMHRILSRRGSLYLHCDPTASHYLRVILDSIFGATQFRSEIVWRRTNSHNKLSRQFGPIHDTILFYSSTDTVVFHPPSIPYSKAYVAREFRAEDENGRFRLNEIMGPGARAGDSGRPWNGYDPSKSGRHWAIPQVLKDAIGGHAATLDIHQQLDKLLSLGLIRMSRSGRPKYKQYVGGGIPLQDIWAFQPGTEGVLYETDDCIDQDVKYLDSEKERLGYPTQKPRGLLERILRTSTDPGSVILDPFCGCGTAIEAAEKLGRSWMGIDITHHAIDIIEGRLAIQCPKAEYDVKGRPEDLASAYDLARRDKYEFQWWTNWLLGVQNYRERKKGGDRGIDGIIYFRNGPWGVGEIIVSVKGGDNLNPAMISALRGTVEREESQMGIFASLAEPTPGMRREAASAGFVTTAQGRFQRLQIVTIEELLSGRRPEMPRPIETEAFRRPLRPARRAGEKLPDPQLVLPLPFTGGKKPRRRDDVEDHLSGHVLAQISAAG